MRTPVDTTVLARTSDIGGFKVQRALPSAQRRMVGPFVFLDQMGPEVLAAGRGLDVAPHPHIGLATVTYLYDGALMHRDSLGVVQAITPGALNWMTAGSGIVHSERSPDDERARSQRVFGIQSWVALPAADEEMAPAFEHHAADALPRLVDGGVDVRLIVGSLGGERSPMKPRSETLYADVQLAAGTKFVVEPTVEERAVYVVDGEVGVRADGSSFGVGTLVVLKPGMRIELHTDHGARFMLLGGEPLDGRRFVWWNFVSSSRERIEQAKVDWRAGRIGQVPGETAWIPLPGEEAPPVNYP